MNRQNYKPMASFFKGKFHERMEFDQRDTDRSTHFGLIATDLHEVQNDLREPRLEVVSKAVGNGCDVVAYMNLGPSDGNVRIQLESIYGEGNLFGRIYSVTLIGEVVGKDGALTGKKISRKYEGSN